MDRQRKAQPTKDIVICTEPSKYRDFFCKICKKLPMQPIRTVPGGCLYCETCFIRNLGQLSNDETMGGFFYDVEARSNIDNLDAECVTCGFKETMMGMEDHVQVCAITKKFQHLAL